MKVIESTSDPRSEYYDLMRRESIPAEELMGRRMETGVLAVLAQLRAKRNWHRIMREWIYGDPPAERARRAGVGLLRGARRAPRAGDRRAEPRLNPSAPLGRGSRARARKRAGRRRRRARSGSRARRRSPRT